MGFRFFSRRGRAGIAHDAMKGLYALADPRMNARDTILLGASYLLVRLWALFLFVFVFVIDVELDFVDIAD